MSQSHVVSIYFVMCDLTKELLTTFSGSTGCALYVTKLTKSSVYPYLQKSF